MGQLKWSAASVKKVWPSAARFQYVQPEGPGAATWGTPGGGAARKVIPTGAVVKPRRSWSRWPVVMAPPFALRNAAAVPAHGKGPAARTFRATPAPQFL